MSSATFYKWRAKYGRMDEQERRFWLLFFGRAKKSNSPAGETSTIKIAHHQIGSKQKCRSIERHFQVQQA